MKQVSTCSTASVTPLPDASYAWYLVFTKPRQEQIALLNLERQGYACYLPLLCTEKLRRRKLAVITEPMFPRYLFIQLSREHGAKSWTPIRSTVGVSHLVYFGSQPAKVDPALIELLRNHQQQHNTEPLFNHGEAVMITEGPFSGIEAVFQMVDAQQRAIVLLDILSRTAPVPIPMTALRKLA